MPINTSWYNEQETIIYIQYQGSWSLEEYHGNIDLTSSMVAEKSHPVVIITDFTKSGAIPPRILSAGKHSETASPDNVLATYIFGLDRYMEMLAKMFQKMFPKSTKGLTFVGSLSEAVEKANQAFENSN